MKNRPRVPHYEIPGLGLELIDILHAKASQFTSPWEFFLWASAMQYLFRYKMKDGARDIRKVLVYSEWLLAELEKQCHKKR